MALISNTVGSLRKFGSSSRTVATRQRPNPFSTLCSEASTEAHASEPLVKKLVARRWRWACVAFGAFLASQLSPAPVHAQAASAAAPAKAAQPSKAGKADEAGKADKAGKAGEAGKADKAGKPAQPRQKDPANKQPANAEQRRAAARERLEAAKKRMEQRGDAGKAQRPRLDPKSPEARERRAKVREMRARARRRALHRRWGNLHERPPARTELRQHAFRLAHLKRMEELARDKENEELLQRIRTLRGKEVARHRRRMQKFQSQFALGASKAGAAQSAPKAVGSAP